MNPLEDPKEFVMRTLPMHALTVGELRERMKRLPDDAQIAVAIRDQYCVITDTIIAFQDNAILLHCGTVA